MIKEWVLRRIELNQYSFLLFIVFSWSCRTVDLCVPIVPIPDLKRSLGLPAPIGGDANAGMRLVWAELGSGIPSSKAEIFIWQPCAHSNRSAWDSLRFGSVDNSRVIFEYVCVEERSFLGIVHFKLIVSVILRISPMLCEVSEIHWRVVKQMVVNQIVRTVRVGYVTCTYLLYIWYSVW